MAVVVIRWLALFLQQAASMLRGGQHDTLTHNKIGLIRTDTELTYNRSHFVHWGYDNKSEAFMFTSSDQTLKRLVLQSWWWTVIRRLCRCWSRAVLCNQQKNCNTSISLKPFKFFCHNTIDLWLMVYGFKNVSRMNHVSGNNWEMLG